MKDESSLIRRTLTHRDNAAFSALVKMHQGKVRTFLLRLCKQYDVADDLAQETFLTAYRKLHSYKGSGSFSGWLYRIAYNCFLQLRRSDSRRRQVTEDYVQNLEVLTDRYDSISTEQMDMEQALAQLNPDETATITLCHSFGFSHQEVSEILRMPLGSVKSNIRRGKTESHEILTRDTLLEAALERAS